MSRPLIGIVADVDPRTSDYMVNPKYVGAAEDAGADVVILAYTGSPDMWLGLADGVLLHGGANDIEPTRYGPPDSRAEFVRRDRDDFEFALIRRAIELDRPLFGICRGAQSINVAMGGSIYTDIATDLGVTHPRQERSDLDQVAHHVEIEAGSLLHRLLGTRTIEVNSRHHQVIRDLPSVLRVAARSADGLVEAVEAPTRRFVLGVQWHPERRTKVDRSSARLFEAFVEAARTS